jgi:hypothetical protein
MKSFLLRSFTIATLLLCAVHTNHAQPTDEEKAAFLSALTEAVSAGDARVLDPLLYTKGMSPESIRAMKSSLDNLIRLLRPVKDELKFTWNDMASFRGPEPTETGGFRYSVNAKPAAVLSISPVYPPVMPSSKPVSTSVILCLEDGRLMFIGNLREPIPTKE